MDTGYVILLLLGLVYCATAIFLYLRARQGVPGSEARQEVPGSETRQVEPGSEELQSVPPEQEEHP